MTVRFAWSRRARWRVAFASAAVASLVLVGPVAAGDWATWAWLGAGIVATAPLLVRPWAAVAVAVACTVGALAVAAWTGGPLVDAAIVTAGIGVSIAAVNWAPVMAVGAARRSAAAPRRAGEAR